MLEGRDDAGDWLRRLREAALMDEKGKTLDGALKTVASFAGTVGTDAAADEAPVVQNAGIQK